MSLNILPAEKKSALAQAEWLKRIRSICIYVIAAFLMIDGFFIFLDINMRSTFNPPTADGITERLSSQAATDIENKINAYVALNASVSAIVANPYDPIEMTGRVLEVINEDTVIDEYTLNSNEQKVSVMGTTRSRQSLAELQSALNDSEYLTDINFPVGDLQVKENIDFEFTAIYIDPELESEAVEEDTGAEQVTQTQ